ncbi:MAG: branched-chain amino acid ABC transporter permease [Candidatus Bathyarchaeia archaeon]|nr:branched-chain amino acid ABC transporter permease [Candidatus Bathyarchaeota archaeon]
MTVSEKKGISRIEWPELLGLTAFFAVLPLFLPKTLSMQILFYALVGLAFDLLYGYGNLLSFGHALFFGVGAYGAAITFNTITGNPLVAIGVGLALTVAVAAAIGPAALRRRDPYFALVMMAFNIFFYQLFVAPLAPWTGSDMGLTIRRMESFWIIDFSNKTTLYYIMLTVAFLLMILIKIFMKSKYGALLIATSESEFKVESLGYSSFKIKYLSLLFSSFLAGASGALFATFLGYSAIDFIAPTFNIIIVFIALIGGSGTFLGPFIGSFIYIALTYLLTVTMGWHASIYLDGVIGLIIIIVMMKFRGGLYRYLYQLAKGVYVREPMR